MSFRIKRSDYLLVGGFVILLLLGVGLIKILFLNSQFFILSIIYAAFLIATIQTVLSRNLALTLELVQKKMSIHYRQTAALQQILSLLSPRSVLPEMRGWGISPDLGLLLVHEIIKHKPKTIVECGSGVSTILAGYALEKNNLGHIWSIENESAFARQTEAELACHLLTDSATIIEAPLEIIKVREKEFHWYSKKALKKLPRTIDLLIVDGPPGHIQKLSRLPAMPFFRDKFAKNATVLLDDAFREDEKQIIKIWKKLFPNWSFELIETEKGTGLFRNLSPS